MEWVADGPRYAIASVNRFDQVKTCLLSECDSWALKAEMLLTHVAYVLGFSSPNQLILQALKVLISGVSTKLATYMDEYPQLEQYFRMIISGLNQVALDHVWDLVRDGAVCMRLNTCDNDFFRQISNIKIKVCDVDDPTDITRKTTICEKLFNDSPLIILSGGMLILMAFANGHLKSKAENTPNENVAVDLPKDNNPDVTQPPSVIPSSQAEAVTDDPTSTNNKQQPPPGNEQIIHAMCPKCNKNFNCTIPRPWPLYCAGNFPLIEKRSKTNSPSAAIFREILKKINCIYCKAQIKQILKDFDKRKKKSSK